MAMTGALKGGTYYNTPATARRGHPRSRPHSGPAAFEFRVHSCRLGWGNDCFLLIPVGRGLSLESNQRRIVSPVSSGQQRMESTPVLAVADGRLGRASSIGRVPMSRTLLWFASLL